MMYPFVPVANAFRMPAYVFAVNCTTSLFLQALTHAFPLCMQTPNSLFLKKKKKGPKKPPVKFQSLCHICIPITPPFPHGQQAISTMKLKQIYMQEIRNIAMMVSRFCQQSLKRENGRFWSDILYVYISSPNYKLTYHTWDPEDTKLEKDPCGTY